MVNEEFGLSGMLSRAVLSGEMEKAEARWNGLVNGETVGDVAERGKLLSKIDSNNGEKQAEL